tara:strand:+ start:975 stop:2084 length:1110 start_codon:yes stop_codon:yes gene_type:complete
MAHLTSRHKLTIDISNAVPTTSAESYEHIYAIQGPTDVLFVLSGIDLGSIGIYDFTANYGDGSSIKNIEPLFINRLPTELSLSAVEHTFYQTTSASSEVNAQIVARYLSDAGAIPSIVTHNIKLKQSAGNAIEKNIEILNTQLFTISAEAVPLINLESDENIIYPCAFIEVEDVERIDDNIYINTDPETIDLDAKYLYRSNVTLTQDLDNFQLSALSGSGFTLQGKSGKLYTAVFGISGEDLRYTYTQNTTSIVLSTDISLYPGISGLQETIITLFDSNGLIGTEFSLISSAGNDIYFYQSNQLPPEATLYTYTTSVSSTIAVGGYTPYAATDNIYSYTTNSFGPSGNIGLSAVNRMKTDPNGLLIRAL